MKKKMIVVLFTIAAVALLSVTTTMESIGADLGADFGKKITDLTDDWNLMSIPFGQPINKVDLKVKYNGVKYTWAQAVSNGFVIDQISGWNRITRTYELVNTLMPGEGYWLFAYVNCTLMKN
jgi:hypothetical protein